MTEGRQPTPIDGGEKELGFKNVVLFKTDSLGAGAYGAVCKAKCDELICAAKLLHPLLLPKPLVHESSKEHRQPFERFQLECHFLSRINHPNIVQYLGTHYDPDANSLVLLMELMDESLTHFLESSPRKVDYNLQVNLNCDIVQALAFLHANGIIHRDLSSNNVLLIAKSRAKVTDFGMSKFVDVGVTRLATMTQCPGTPFFMSPEALNEPPVCTEKLDVFSFGVIVIQIVTKNYPEPSDRFLVRELVDPQFPTSTIRAHVPVPETERRHAHISLIEPKHPLLPIALHCLKDEDVERPSSQQLCQELSAIKETALYKASLNNNQGPQEAEDSPLLSEKQLNTSDVDFCQLATRLEESNRVVEAKEREIRNLNQQAEAKEEVIASLQNVISEKESEVNELRRILLTKDEQAEDFSMRLQQLELRMGEGQQDQEAPSKEKAVESKAVESSRSLPEALIDSVAGSSAIVANAVYFQPKGSKTVYACKFPTMQWSVLPKHPNTSFAIVCVNEMLTTVGGRSSSGWFVQAYSKKLYSFVDGGWVELFPPMQAKHIDPIAMSTGHTLVVIGSVNASSGSFDADYSYADTTVEVLNTHTKVWSKVSSLPFTLFQASGQILEDYIYLAAESKQGHYVFKCSLSALVQSNPNSNLWGTTLATLPVTCSSLVTGNGRLLAVGGKANKLLQSDIFGFDPTTNSWIFVCQMSNARSRCLTAPHPENKLIVVGGTSKPQKEYEIILLT